MMSFVFFFYPFCGSYSNGSGGFGSSSSSSTALFPEEADAGETKASGSCGFASFRITIPNTSPSLIGLYRSSGKKERYLT